MFCLTLVISGAVEHGNHYTLNLAYEHILERTACNMTYGPFGGVKSESSCYVHCTCLFVMCELYCRQNTCSSRAVIKGPGPGIFHRCYECDPHLLLQENRRKIEPRKFPSCWIPCLLLVSSTCKLEILMTALSSKHRG